MYESFGLSERVRTRTSVSSSSSDTAKMLLILFIVLLLQGIQAINYHYKSTKSGPFSEFLIESFGMAHQTEASISYQIAYNPIDAMNTSYSANYYILFLILNEDQKSWYGAGGTSRLSAIQSMCSTPSLQRYIITDQNNTISYTFPSADRYSVMLLQCYTLPNSDDTIDFDVRVVMTNPMPYSSNKFSHLPIQYVTILPLLQGELVIYCFLIIGIFCQIYFNRQRATKMHLLFGFTLLMTLIFLAVEYTLYHHYNTNGIDSSSLEKAVGVTDHFNNFTSLVSILYLSLGLSTVRETLNDKEKRFGTAVLVSYFIFGIAGGTCIENDETCSALWLATYVLRSLVLLGVIISLNFTVTQLRGNLLYSPWVTSSPILYARVKQFQTFRLVLIAYLLLPTAFLLIESTVLSWKEEWVTTLLNDLLNLYVAVHIGVTFSPLETRFLTRPFDGVSHENRRAD